MIQTLRTLVTPLAASLLIATAPAGNDPDAVRLNDLQFIGVHNAYHIEPDRAVFAAMHASGYHESASWPAERLTRALAYTHDPLDVQLDRGVRVLELDLHDDPAGGRFAQPGALVFSGTPPAHAPAPVDPEGDLSRPGFKVFHAADIDVRSRCLRFVRCLETIHDWSRAHPGHLPIFIQLETKEGIRPAIGGRYTPTASTPFDQDSWRRLHAEIRTVFNEDDLLLPRDVQGRFPSVNAAVRTVGWPTLASSRGRIVFLLLDDVARQDAYAAFVGEAGETPLIFVARDEHDPLTAWLIRPSPKTGDIERLIRSGFLVYTRADAHTEQARHTDYRRAQRAFASGAQFIATDFPVPDPRYGPYQARFDTTGNPYVRCNPVRTDRDCTAGD
ncbi:Ca2+-dependent phosphoinositide-specific phospholipase C [Parapedomonas caeni]